MNALKGRVALRGWSALDRRTRGAQELLAWRGQLVADLGGEQELTAAKLALVELAAKTWLYIGVLDTWILEQRGIVNLRRRSVLPVVRERQQLVDSLTRLLGQLGLERRAQKVPALHEYVKAKYGSGEPERAGSPTQRAAASADGAEAISAPVNDVCTNAGEVAQ